MPNLSPYRTLSATQRITLVSHDLTHNPDNKNGYIRSIVARGGGFRPEKLRTWPAEQLAREVVRHNLESPQDELGLLLILYLELEPAIQIGFLDATGVKHEAGSIPDGLDPPFADAATVRKAAEMVLATHGDEGRRYLRTIALYNGDAWPGLAELIAAA